MTYAYIRVSTDKQTVENQRFEIDNYCKSRQIRIDRYIEETVSGIKPVDKRELGTLIRRMKKDDTLIASEISRFGRRLLEVMSILKMLMDKKVNVITVKEHFELGDNLQSHVIAFAFSLASEIERSLISQRTKEALARRKAMGQKLGRKTGGTNARHKLDAQSDLIRTMLDYGCTKAEICRRVGCTYGTLMKHLARMGVEVKPRHRVRISPRRAETEAAPRPSARRKNRKVILLSTGDRPLHIQRKAAVWQYRRDARQNPATPIPALVQEPPIPSRPRGEYHHMLADHEKLILRMLRQGFSKTYIAKYLGCNIKTLDAHLKRMGVKIVKG